MCSEGNLSFYNRYIIHITRIEKSYIYRLDCLILVRWTNYVCIESLVEHRLLVLVYTKIGKHILIKKNQRLIVIVFRLTFIIFVY